MAPYGHPEASAVPCQLLSTLLPACGILPPVSQGEGGAHGCDVTELMTSEVLRKGKGEEGSGKR